jgi:hypothetical protein
MNLKPHKIKIHPKALTSIAMQSLQYNLFHYTPGLFALAQANGEDILKPFLHWADEKHLIMDWMTHLHLLNWLHQQNNWRPWLNVDRIRELLTAAVIRWSQSGLDHVTARGLMVASKHMPGKALGLWKSTEVAKNNKVVLIHLPKKITPETDCYAITYTQGSWDKAHWMELPAYTQNATIHPL